MDQRVVDAVDRGDFGGAAAIAVSHYGAEIFGFLIGVLDHGGAAHDVYGTFCARLAGELRRESRGCSLRVRMYAVAGKALADHRLTTSGRAPEVQASSPRLVPTPLVTERFQRADSYARICALRRVLSQDERELLVLRVDRGLSWNDLAVISLGDAASPLDLRRESRRIETRFRAIREGLARSAVNLGLLPHVLPSSFPPPPPPSRPPRVPS